LWPFGNTTVNLDSAIQSFNEKRIKIVSFESPLNQSRGSNYYPTIFINGFKSPLNQSRDSNFYPLTQDSKITKLTKLTLVVLPRCPPLVPGYQIQSAHSEPPGLIVKHGKKQRNKNQEMLTKK
jgi:hypothetical protein